MNGAFMPENVRAFGDLVTDLSNHRDGVQFIHRNFAYVVATGFVAFALALLSLLLKVLHATGRMITPNAA